jgi:hypothetical protein
LPWWFQIGNDLGPGSHKVVIKLLDKKNPKAPASPAHCDGSTPDRQPFRFAFRRLAAVGPDALK